MFITNVWDFWRLLKYFWRLSGDSSEIKRNQTKTNEKLIEFIFISFSMFYRHFSVVFQANNWRDKFS